MRSQGGVDKFVDKYFLPHFYNHIQKQHFHHGNKQSKNNHCNLCQKIAETEQQNESVKREVFINQHDIDILELMDPKTTPEIYMKKILHLYKKEENLRPKEPKNEPMQLHFTTRKIINTSSKLSKQAKTLDFQSDDNGINIKEQLSQERIDREEISRLRDQCYLSLGKMIVRRKEISSQFTLGKSNYHTRQYLLPRVQNQVRKMSAQNKEKGLSKFYLIAGANSRGINFEVQKMPPMLSQVLQFNKFREVVCTLNSIIQQTVYQYKTERTKNKKMNPLYLWQWFILFFLVTLLIANNLAFNSEILTIVCMVISVCMIMFILMISCHRFHEETPYVSLIDQLNVKISDYLDYLNSRPDANLVWKTQRYLYWIQISHKNQPD